MKKLNRPTWDEYFISIARLVSTRSTCLRRKVGSILVRDKKILATGYNGAPSNIKHCQRIIKESNPEWWLIENPASGTMKDYLGKPELVYHPWWYGSPWTKKTALWGKFNIPVRQYYNWEDVPKNPDLYIRPNRIKPGFNFLHKSAIQFIPEFEPFKDRIDSDNAFRSLCSQGFAKAFKEVNK